MSSISDYSFSQFLTEKDKLVACDMSTAAQLRICGYLSFIHPILILLPNTLLKSTVYCKQYILGQFNVSAPILFLKKPQNFTADVFDACTIRDHKKTLVIVSTEKKIHKNNENQFINL